MRPTSLAFSAALSALAHAALALAVAGLGLGLATAGCGKDSRAATDSERDTAALGRAGTNCLHAACGDNFFIDIAPAGPCAPGATCSAAFTLAATGDFHINDEYPYKFKADDAPGVEFLGTDGAGKNVFSKVANDWRKNSEKTGTMTVKWRPAAQPPDQPPGSASVAVSGERSIAGVFKLSVCSAQNCQLEQVPLKATVAVR